MRILSALLLTLFVWGGPLPVAASEPIDIGGVSASLGDDKDALLESLRKQYEVQELRAETYLVFKGHPSGNTIGVVHFRNGKLVWASRDVGAFEGEAVRTFAQTLFEVLAKVNAEDRTPILITTQISTAQPIAVSSLTLEFPGRSVVVDVAYDDKLVGASIEEIVHSDDTTLRGAPKTPTDVPGIDGEPTSEVPTGATDPVQDLSETTEGVIGFAPGMLAGKQRERD